MRQFQKILLDLKKVVASHRPGDLVVPPAALPSISIDGRRLSYVPMGLDHDENLPAVILLHGFGGFFMDWPRVMAHVGRHARVFALDLPGWGFSDLNPHAHGIEDDVAAVRAFVDQMGLKDVIVCGISYGAGVAWAAAALGAEGIPQMKRAVLLNPMPPRPIDYMKSPIYRGIFNFNRSRVFARVGSRLLRKSHYKTICRESLLNFRLLDSFYLDLAFLMIKQPKMPHIFHAHARGAQFVDWRKWEERLRETTTPVTIMQALNDRIFSMESAQHLHELIPGAELIEVPDCGHAMVFDQHRKVSDFLIQCVDQSRGKSVASRSSDTLADQSG